MEDDVVFREDSISREPISSVRRSSRRYLWYADCHSPTKTSLRSSSTLGLFLENDVEVGDHLCNSILLLKSRPELSDTDDNGRLWVTVVAGESITEIS